ncbi:hypothetical protein [Nocardia nova]|uniref:hypothetical protein n=1 Tax=Nocardia nova TaxID=37330 RepID=UPI0011DE19DA|nr:hypothetical protein [Nocardia nova]
MTSALIAAMSCTVIAACGDSSTPTATTTGAFVLSSGFAFQEDNGSLIRPAELATDANPFSFGCTGIGPFADVAKGAVVSMLDGSDKVIATGKVTETNTSTGPDTRYTCQLSFEIPKAPVGVSGAQVRIGQHSPVALDADYATGHSMLNLVQ